MLTKDNKMVEGELALLLRVTEFAASKHRDQRRKDNARTPYINHPIAVANIISNEGEVHDINILCAAVLHDTVEDTDTTFEEIEEYFGQHIRSIVEECSDDMNLPVNIRKQKQIDYAPIASYEAKVVKLADKLHNLRDIERDTPVGWGEERVHAYFRWASEVVKGLKGTCAPLEQRLEEMFRKRNITRASA